MGRWAQRRGSRGLSRAAQGRAHAWWPRGRAPTRGESSQPPGLILRPCLFLLPQEHDMFTISLFLLLQTPVNPLSHYSVRLLSFLSAPPGCLLAESSCLVLYSRKGNAFLLLSCRECPLRPVHHLPDRSFVSANGLCRPVCEMVCPSSLGSLPPAATPLPPAALGCGGNGRGASRCRPPGLSLHPHILHRQHVSQDCSDGVFTRGSTTSNTEACKKQTGGRNNGELDASGESDIN